MAVQKIEKNGRTVWRAAIKLNGRKAKAFRKTRAEAIEAEAELRARLKREGDGPSKEERRVVPTVAELWPEYLDFCRSPAASRHGPNSPNTITEKEQNYRCYIGKAFGTTRLDAIDARAVDRFAAKLHGKGLRPNTIGNILITLRRFLNVAERWGLIDKVPRFTARKEKPDRLERDMYLDPDEAERFLVAAPPEWRTLLLFMLRTGIRTGETKAVRWSDLDLDRKIVHIEQSVTKKGTRVPKGRRKRSVPLTWDLIEALREHPRRGPRVFCDDEGKTLAVNTIERVCKRVCRLAALQREDGKPKLLGGHALRHSWASACAMSGVSLQVLQRWGGWQSIEMVLRYAHLAPDFLVQEVDKIAPRRPLHAVDGARIAGPTTGPTRTEANEKRRQAGA